MSDDTTQEYVYGIGHPHGYVKLGRSTEPGKRLREHQISCPYELWLVAAVPVDDSHAVEDELHDHFADTHVRGEWFELTHDDYDDLNDMMKMAASSHDFESVAEFRAWQQRKREALL